MSSRRRPTHTIVLGNEKGGAGKTTTAMHIIIGLMRMGFSVASIDLDHRQRSLSRYIENRARWIRESGIDVGLPEHRIVAPSDLDSRSAAMQEEKRRLEDTAAELSQRADFLVVDCPGSDVPMARFGHGLADTLITPLNDSLVDLDVLGQLAPDDLKLTRAGVYASMVWQQRQARLSQRHVGMDWMVLRTRLSGLADRNKVQIAQSLERMSQILGFRIVSGFGERVIYRYLFLAGLTVLDLRQAGIEVKDTKSHQAARDEVRGLLEALWIPHLKDRLPLV